jgi:hypothetical protein
VNEKLGYSLTITANGVEQTRSSSDRLTRDLLNTSGKIVERETSFNGPGHLSPMPARESRASCSEIALGAGDRSAPTTNTIRPRSEKVARCSLRQRHTGLAGSAAKNLAESLRHGEDAH